MSALDRDEIPCPGRLWSLLDMLEIKARPFVQAVTHLAALASTIQTLKQQKVKGGDEAIPAQHRRSFRRSLRIVGECCVALSAPLTKIEADRLTGMLKGERMTYVEAGDELDRISRLLGNEIASLRLFTLGSRTAAYYGLALEIFGTDAVIAFPRAEYDLEEAAKSLAVSRNTACVFHLMRAMEVTVQDLGKAIGLTNVDKRWGFLLSDIDARIEQLPKGEQRAHWSLTRASLWHVKEAWRNDTMHPKQTYTDEEARDVLEAVRAFFRSLSGMSGPSDAEELPD